MPNPAFLGRWTRRVIFGDVARSTMDQLAYLFSTILGTRYQDLDDFYPGGIAYNAWQATVLAENTTVIHADPERLRKLVHDEL